MKIATYNLCFLYGEGMHKHSGKDYMFSEDFVEERINYFVKEFTKVNADILFVQELGSEEVLKKIIQKMEENYEYFIAEPDVNGVGNAVLYKINNCKCESVPAKTSLPVFIDKDQDMLGSRMYSRRDFVHLSTMYNNKIIHFLGIHIKSNFLVPEQSVNGVAKPMISQTEVAEGRIRSEFFRFSRAKKVRELVDNFFIDSDLANVVVLGDFNSHVKNPVFKIIQGEVKDSPDYLIPITNDISKDGLIDHILVSKNIKEQVLSVEILNDYEFDSKSKDSFPYFIESDHPILMFSLK